MRMRLILVAVLTTAFIWSALNEAIGADGETATAVKTVAVRSYLGTQFHGRLIGTTIFNNRYFEGDVPDWRIDQTAVEIVLEHLNAKSSYQASAIGDDSSGSDLRALLKQARERNDDYLILIQSGQSQNQPHFAPGYGILRRSILGAGRDCIYSTVVFELYQVKTGKFDRLKWGNPTDAGIQCFGKQRAVGWKDDFSQYSEAEKESLRLSILDSLVDQTPRGLDRLLKPRALTRAQRQKQRLEESRRKRRERKRQAESLSKDTSN